MTTEPDREETAATPGTVGGEGTAINVEPEAGSAASTTSSRRGFPDIRSELDRLWDAVAGSPWTPFRGSSRPWTPTTDVFKKDDLLHIRAELPGLTEKDVEITATADSLTITGEKSEEKEVTAENYYRSERSYGRFTSQIALPPGAQTDRASARIKNGVLEIEIPLAPEASPKVIEIKPEKA